jgi:hypothetical protein
MGCFSKAAQSSINSEVEVVVSTTCLHRLAESVHVYNT